MGCSTITKRSNRLDKKAVIEVQFNWIFILIAGAVILIFFITLVAKQRNVSDVTYSTNVLKNMETIMTSAGVAIGSTQLIELANTRIDFGCDAYSVGKVQRNLKGNIVFAPSYLQGRYILTWTQSFDVPFRATNFLYLTTPEIRYMIVDEGNYAPKLFDLLPKEEAEVNEDTKLMMNKGLVNLNAETEIEDQNNYKVRVIFFGDVNIDDIAAKIKRTADDDVSALKIIPRKEILNSYGDLEFYEKKGNRFVKTGTTKYFTQSMLFGAIFTDDFETYECLKGRALEKIKTVASVYKERSNQISNSDDYDENSLCSAIHNVAALNLGNMMSSESPEPLYDFLNTLKNQNREALRFSCAVIY